MKMKNAKRKRIFKTGFVKMIDEILDNTESEGDHPLGWHKLSTSAMNSLKEERNNSLLF